MALNVKGWPGSRADAIPPDWAIPDSCRPFISPAPWPTGRNDTEKDGPTDHGKATQAEIDAHNFRIEEGGRGL